MGASRGRMKNFFCLGFAVLGFSMFACAPVDEPNDDAADEETVASEEDLTTARVKSIEVHRSTGFRPPPPPGGCHPSGAWTFNFTTRTLTGNACVAAHPVAVNKVLSESDASRVRVALSKVRVTARPPACPTDMPISSLDVKRAQSSVHYVDARAACGGGSVPVRESTLANLVSLLEELSAPAANLPACVKTGCSGQICADQHRVTTCIWRPEFACYHNAVCERDADGACGWKQTPTLSSCLGNN